jgi:hypothetical protein
MILISYKIKRRNKFGTQISYLSGAAMCDRPQTPRVAAGTTALLRPRLLGVTRGQIRDEWRMVQHLPASSTLKYSRVLPQRGSGLAMPHVSSPAAQNGTSNATTPPLYSRHTPSHTQLHSSMNFGCLTTLGTN